MKRFLSITIVATVLLAAITLRAKAELNIGSDAPPLHVSEWVKGTPVDLAKDASKRIHVLEFWAVWCPPCKMSVPLLTDMQKKFGKDVTIIGITEPDMGQNSPSAVRRFVKERGSQMDYTVAIDSGRTTQSYMVAAGAMGIPHAFVIDKKGKIAWQGSPLDPELDSVLTQLVAGTYDVEAAKVAAQVQSRIEQIGMLAQMGQWRGVWDGLVDVLKIDPANEFALSALRDIAVEELNDAAGFRGWATLHLEAHRKNRKAMQNLANTLWSAPDLRTRFPDLALNAAKAAYEAPGKRNAGTVATYARAMYHLGALDRAITLQQDAVALVGDDERDAIRDTLNYYRTCKRLLGTLE